MEERFIDLCNRLLYSIEVNEEAANDQTEDIIFDAVLSGLMKHCYHEIALEFERVLTLLPLEKLSGEILCGFLPPPNMA